MALTRNYQRIGTSTYTVTGNNELRLYAKYNSQSIANNTSNVTLQLRTIALNGSYYSSGNSSTLNCYGNRGTQYYDIGTVNTSSEKVIGTWTFDLGHNANGVLTGVYASASANVYGSITPSVAGTFDLPTIPRQANVVNASDFTDETNPTITFSNPAGFRINARLEFGGTYIQRDNIPNTGSYTFELTNEERDLLRSKTPNDNTLNVREVIATCYSGTTESASSWQDKKMTIVNANPIFNNFEFEDINPVTLALTGNNQYNINGYSNIKTTISTTNKATAKKGASMSKYRFTCGTNTPKDITYSSSENVSETINGATSGIYNIYAIDSRKNTTLVTKIADRTIDYQPVYIDKQNTSISRNDNQVGDRAILTLNGTFWNNSFGQVTNNISVSYKFKKSDSSTWIDGTTTITPTITDEKFSFTGQIASDNSDTSWDLEANYDVKIIVEDELSATEYDIILNSAIPTMSFDKEGVGILCAYDRTVGGGGQLKGNPLAYYYIGCIIETYTSTNPSDYFGGTWQRYGTGKVTVDVDTSDTDFDTIGQSGGSKIDDLSNAYARVGRSNADYSNIAYKSKSGAGTFNRLKQSAGGIIGGDFSIVDATELGGSVSTLQPYITVYRWRRTA